MTRIREFEANLTAGDPFQRPGALVVLRQLQLHPPEQVLYPPQVELRLILTGIESYSSGKAASSARG